MIPVSILIPVRNESANIEDCLESVRWSDDVVVVDSNSTDDTCSKAARLGATVIQFQYQRGGLKKKNWALRNAPFRHDWVLILDADERVLPGLVPEISEALQSDYHKRVGYYVNRRFFFLGRWIRHAGYFPSWNLRLLKRGYGEYEVIPDWCQNTGDNEVHEHIQLRGEAGYLHTPLDHFAYPTISSFVEKHNRYSSWEALVRSDYLRLSEDRSGIAPHLRIRRIIKALGRRAPMADVLRFLYHYFWRLGFLDGREGYILCRLLAEYELLIYAKSIEASSGNNLHGGKLDTVSPVLQVSEEIELFRTQVTSAEDRGVRNS
jgi:glycosyltransferase involved in cell wall biosynthesis